MGDILLRLRGPRYTTLRVQREVVRWRNHPPHSTHNPAY
jgi:hypothetical protein